jgi:O-antigen/teichoic acid export membrane protein
MKRLSANLAALLGADLVRRLAGFITVAYLARVLGAERFGIVNIGWTALAYGLAVSAAGLPTLAARRIAAGSGEGILPGFLGSRIVTAVVVFTAILAVAILGIHDRITATVVAVMGIGVLAQAFWVDWYFQGRESLSPVAGARVLSAVCYLTVVLVFVRTPGDLLWVAGGAVMGDILAADIMLRIARKRGVMIRIDLRPETVMTLLRESFPLTVGGVLGYLSINFPTIALALLSTTLHVGIYGAATKLVFFLLVGDRILSTLLLPASARLYAESPDHLAKTLDQSLRWVVLLAVPIAVGGMILARPAIALVFGPTYAASAAVLQIFIWYFVLTMIHTIVTTGVIAVGRERAYGRIMAVTAFLYVVSVCAGVWLFQEQGAAAAVVCSEAISAVLLYRELRRTIRVRVPERLFGIAGALVVMGGAVYALRLTMPVLPVIVGAAAYVLVLFAARGLTREDLRLLRERF